MNQRSNDVCCVRVRRVVPEKKGGSVASMFSEFLASFSRCILTSDFCKRCTYAGLLHRTRLGPCYTCTPYHNTLRSNARCLNNPIDEPGPPSTPIFLLAIYESIISRPTRGARHP